MSTDAGGKANCKESRLSFAMLSTQLIKFTDETIYRLEGQLERLSVRKSGNLNLPTFSDEKGDVMLQKKIWFPSLLIIFSTFLP